MAADPIQTGNIPQPSQLDRIEALLLKILDALMAEEEDPNRPDLDGNPSFGQRDENAPL